MEKTLQQEIAKALRLSNATVHKALYNCPGISFCTKYRVQQYAMTKGYCIQRKGQIAVVYPANPKTFWMKSTERLYEYLKDVEDVEVIGLAYSEKRSDDDNLAEIIQCIEAAIEAEVSVLIAVVPDNKSIRELLIKYATRICIILIGEYADVPNTFYLGEDPFISGYELGQNYLRHYPNNRSFSMICRGNNTKQQQRSAGFIKALNECGIYKYDIWNEADLCESVPYLIARKLGEKKVLPDCVFCANTNAYQVSDALLKMKTQKTVQCIGFALMAAERTAKHDDILKVVSCPDIDGQISVLVDNIKQYALNALLPEKKHLFVPNKIMS